MGRVIITNVDDRVLERLKARARTQRKSFEQSLRDLLSEAAQPDRSELVREAERIRAMSPGQQAGCPTTEKLIRKDRDER